MFSDLGGCILDHPRIVFIFSIHPHIIFECTWTLWNVITISTTYHKDNIRTLITHRCLNTHTHTRSWNECRWHWSKSLFDFVCCESYRFGSGYHHSNEIFMHKKRNSIRRDHFTLRNELKYFCFNRSFACEKRDAENTIEVISNITGITLTTQQIKDFIYKHWTQFSSFE